MASEISLFSQKSFIEASKKFVCVRLGSYESKKHQDMVRDLLKGTFQNTAFVVYAPDGKTKLTRSGRAPHHALGRSTTQSMNALAAKYKQKDKNGMTVLQDFHSFKQSLNVSSADQRLLLFTVPTKVSIEKTRKILQKVFNHNSVSGRFHFDMAGKEDSAWKDKVAGEQNRSGYFIIRSDQFGQTGQVMTELPLEASVEDIKKALLKANAVYSKDEKRKHYNSHVTAGRRKGINFQNTMPPGEDRDGDGKIDNHPKRRPKE